MRRGHVESHIFHAYNFICTPLYYFSPYSFLFKSYSTLAQNTRSINPSYSIQFLHEEEKKLYHLFIKTQFSLMFLTKNLRLNGFYHLYSSLINIQVKNYYCNKEIESIFHKKYLYINYVGDCTINQYYLNFMLSNL